MAWHGTSGGQTSEASSTNVVQKQHSQINTQPLKHSWTANPFKQMNKQNLCIDCILITMKRDSNITASMKNHEEHILALNPPL